MTRPSRQPPPAYVRSKFSQVVPNEILNTPEMKAIKKALYNYIAYRVMSAEPKASVDEILAKIDLPRSVYEWAVSK